MSAVETVKVEKVSLKPIIRNGWLPKGHDGEYKFTGTETWLVPHRNSQTGQRQTGLTEEDERRLELKLKMTPGTLSKYNEDYWSNFKIKIPKEGKTFFLDNPKDELDVLVLRANDLVANSQMEIMDSPKATFYLASLEKEAEVENRREKTEREAIKKFGQLSSAEMINVLKVYSISSTNGANKYKYTASTPVDLIETTLYNKLKESPEEFLRIVNDRSFKTKVFIDDCLAKRILIRNGAKYSVYGGDIIGYNLQTTIDYLEDPSNQDMFLNLKAKLELAE